MAFSLGKLILLVRSQRTTILAVGLLVFVWTVRWQFSDISIDHSWSRIKGHLGGASNGNETHTPPIITSPPKHLGGSLPTDIDLSDPDAPFISWPLKRTCSEVDEWLPGVVFMCDNNFGGVGNVRNFILTCVRYAIEAGATGIVMPAIRKRMDDDIKVIFNNKLEFRPFGYLFDEDNFRQAMAESCPQITLYDDWTDVPNIKHLSDGSGDPHIEEIDPREMDRIDGDKCDFAELDRQTDRFAGRFKEFVRDPKNGTPASETNTRLFRGTPWPGVLWEWPVIRDGPEFANTFGGLCKFNRTIMRLGKKVLANMQALARDQTRALGIMSSSGGDASRFFGAHLRTEADAESFWPTYKEQEKAYLSKAKELGLKAGYVASGNLTEARKLQTAAKKQLGMTMVSKTDLLDDEGLRELESMSWDQQGLVDYIVLTGAEYFGGSGRSSFSISLSLKRHLKDDGLYSRPYKLRPDGYGRSFVVGPMDKYYEHWLFIWDAMWP